MPKLYSLAKFGRNSDVDTGGADVYDVSTVTTYPWPAADATTTVVSSSADDAAAGTGARTVQIEGCDDNYQTVTQTATLNGLTPVTLATDLFRVWRVKVMTAGSGSTNAGDVDVKHSATVLARVSTGVGQSLMAIYTVPKTHINGQGISRCEIQQLWVGVLSGTPAGTDIDVSLYVRTEGGSWRTQHSIGVPSDAGAYVKPFPAPVVVQAGSDIRVTVDSSSGNNADVSAGFEAYVYSTGA